MTAMSLINVWTNKIKATRYIECACETCTTVGYEMESAKVWLTSITFSERSCQLIKDNSSIK